jgi:hypothetical protein
MEPTEILGTVGVAISPELIIFSKAGSTKEYLGLALGILCLLLL